MSIQSPVTCHNSHSHVEVYCQRPPTLPKAFPRTSYKARCPRYLYIVLEELIRELKICFPAVHPRVVMSASVIGDGACRQRCERWPAFGEVKFCLLLEGSKRNCLRKKYCLLPGGPERKLCEICRDPKGTVVDFCYHPVLTECPKGRFPKIHYMHTQSSRVPAGASIEAR